MLAVNTMTTRTSGQYSDHRERCRAVFDSDGVNVIVVLGHDLPVNHVPYYCHTKQQVCLIHLRRAHTPATARL